MKNKPPTGGIVHERDALKQENEELRQKFDRLEKLYATDVRALQTEREKLIFHIKDLNDKARMAIQRLNDAKEASSGSIGQGTGAVAVHLLLGIDRAIQRLQ